LFENKLLMKNEKSFLGVNFFKKSGFSEVF